jgi:hypothetical protein
MNPLMARLQKRLENMVFFLKTHSFVCMDAHMANENLEEWQLLKRERMLNDLNEMTEELSELKKIS